MAIIMKGTTCYMATANRIICMIVHKLNVRLAIMKYLLIGGISSLMGTFTVMMGYV